MRGGEPASKVSGASATAKAPQTAYNSPHRNYHSTEPHRYLLARTLQTRPRPRLLDAQNGALRVGRCRRTLANRATQPHEQATRTTASGLLPVNRRRCARAHPRSAAPRRGTDFGPTCAEPQPKVQPQPKTAQGTSSMRCSGRHTGERRQARAGARGVGWGAPSGQVRREACCGYRGVSVLGTIWCDPP